MSNRSTYPKTTMLYGKQEQQPALTNLLRLVFCVCLLLPSTHANEDVAIAFLTDCSIYSDWQTVAMAFSYKMSKQPGSIKRVMCCKDQERNRYNDQLLSLMPTHVAPSFAINPRTGDNYAAYNKPGAVVDWMAKSYPSEHWVLILDSDMLLRNMFHPNNYNTSRGWAVSAPYTYLIGSTNELWTRHIPDIPARLDTLAGPYGRHADQVGGFFFMHRDDMQRVAPLWLATTEEVREDPEAWRLAGDVYVEKGGRPWISEMYGYVFGAAKANVWHKWHESTMLYPGYNPPGIPKVMHYGLLFSVDDYQFDKHWHFDFDVTVCPPWTVPLGKRTKSGIFPPPPWPTQIKSYANKGKQGDSSYYRDLLSLETITTLNAGFCDFHLKHCPPTQQLLEVCTMAITQYMDVMTEVQEEEAHYQCKDTQDKCQQWADAGECEKNASYMNENCRQACGVCAHLSEATPRTAPTDTLQMLQQLASKLGVEMPTHSPGDPLVFVPGKRLVDAFGRVIVQHAGRAEVGTHSGDAGAPRGDAQTSTPNGAGESTQGGGATEGGNGASTDSNDRGWVNNNSNGSNAASGGGSDGRAGNGGSGTGVQPGLGLGAGDQKGVASGQGGQGVSDINNNNSGSSGDAKGGADDGSGVGKSDSNGGVGAPKGAGAEGSQHQEQHVQPEDELSLDKRQVVRPDEQGSGAREAKQPESRGGPELHGGGGEHIEGTGVGGSQVQQQQEVSTKSVSALLLRCYRMPLKLDEVKDCVGAARKHVEWVRPPSSGSDSVEDDLDSQGMQGLTVSKSQPSRSSRKLVLPTKDKNQPPSNSDAGGSPSHEISVLPGMITWQVCGIWLLAVLVFIAAMPRLNRLRKRGRASR